MSTAVLFSGQLRSFSQCYPTLKWQVFRHYEDCHFFFVMQNDAQANSLSQIQRDYPGCVHGILMDDPKDLPEISQEAGLHAPYSNAAPHKQLLMQHWYQNKVWEYFQQERGDMQFDTIIRMRPDNWMQTFVEPYINHWYNPNYLTEELDIKKQVLAPWWGKFGGINDRFAIMDFESAPIYFSLYNSIPSLLKDGCPFHPESLLLAHLEKNGIKVNHTLNAIFGTLRMQKPNPENPNQMIQEMRFPEIQSHEIAEYARTR